MADPTCEILLLAEPALGSRPDLQSLRARRRPGRGSVSTPSVLCLSAPADHGLDDLASNAPAWDAAGSAPGRSARPRPRRRRRARPGSCTSSRPDGRAGLAIAERWRIPYLLSVVEFPRRDFRLRLSRAWCRGLVVPGRELAEALVGEFGVPGRSIHEIARGVAARRARIGRSTRARPGPCRRGGGATGLELGVLHLPQRREKSGRRRGRRRVPHRRRGGGRGGPEASGRAAQDRRAADLRRRGPDRPDVLERSRRLLPDLGCPHRRATAPAGDGQRHPVDRHGRRGAPVAGRATGETGLVVPPGDSSAAGRGRSSTCSGIERGTARLRVGPPSRASSIITRIDRPNDSMPHSIGSVALEAGLDGLRTRGWPAGSWPSTARRSRASALGRRRMALPGSRRNLSGQARS